MFKNQKSLPLKPLFGLLLIIATVLLVMTGLLLSPLAFAMTDFSVTADEETTLPDYSGGIAQCNAKMEFAGVVFDGRDLHTKEEVLKSVEDEWRNDGHKKPWWKVVDLQRVVNDIYRTSSRTGNYRVTDKTKYQNSELETCLYEAAFPSW